MKLHYAEVIDNNDPKFQGRVKVKVHHLHDGFSDDMCPWSLMFKFSVGGMTAEQSSTPFGSMQIPKKNSFVWVFFADEENKKHPYYMADVSSPAMNLLHNTKVTTAIQSVINTTISIPPPNMTVAYPDLHYTLYPNGLVIGISASDSNADCFIMNINSKSYMSMNSAGDIHIKGNTITALGAQGVVLPDPTTKGAWCALKNCLFTGAPHTGGTIT